MASGYVVRTVCVLVFLAWAAPAIQVYGDAATSQAVYNELAALANNANRYPNYFAVLSLLKKSRMFDSQYLVLPH